MPASRVKERLGEVFCFEPVRADSEMRITDRALDSVIYIGGLIDRDPVSENFMITGTGFFVAHNKNFFIVTAKHVIEDIGDFPCAIRLNTKEGQAKILPIPATALWHCHSDRSVDVAVLPWVPDHHEYRWQCTPTGRFLTQPIIRKAKIGVGDQVITVGLFSAFEGQSRNAPLVRIGHIAMMAGDEQVTSKRFGPMTVHLIEAHSMAGLSGAPVTVRQTVGISLNPNRAPGAAVEALWGTGELFLLGLNHGQWEIPAKDRKRKGIDPNAILHSAISAVVPAPLIGEVIDRAMKQKRKANGELKPTSLHPKQKRKNRDIEIPPIRRSKFFDDLVKATSRDKK